MPIPTPPVDNSGGYMVIKYSNGTDTHRMRVHVRPMNPDGTFSAPSATSNPSVGAEFSAFVALLQPFFPTNWTFSLDAVYTIGAGGVPQQLFGFTPPAQVNGTSTQAQPVDQNRAVESIMNFKDGYGGRARIILIGLSLYQLANAAPSVKGGSPTGDPWQKIVDYVSTASKSNIVSRNGHVLQSPAHLTFTVNRRLRRHYGFA